MLLQATNVPELRTIVLPWREANQTIAFVPTMGALHRGHMELIATAKKMAARVVVSIFVNPLQFGAHEDLNKYPRPLEHDIQMLTEAGCDLLYAPTVNTIYPAGFATSIDPGLLGNILEGKARPGHFNGVATVVIKLLLQLLPDAALFGEKDYQQLLVIRQTVRDLNLPIKIFGVPTVRDADGLALSSRNAYLTPDERQRATVIPRVLQETAAALRQGAQPDVTLANGRKELEAAGFTVDYLEFASAMTLTPLQQLNMPARLLVAARIGTTRLIDNISV